MSVPVNAYCFKPKGGADTPKLLVVFAEESKNIGAASALAKSLGYKDARAADESLVQEVLAVKKSEVSSAALNPNNAANVAVVVSASLLGTESISLANASLSGADFVAQLTSAQVQYKEVTFGEKGADPPAPAAKPAKPAAKEAKKPEAAGTELENAGLTIKKLGDDFGGWYQQVLTKAEMIDYYDISGCYVLRPPSYYIWERITAFFDGEIKKLGVENTYFPMFVSRKVLEKEKDHIEGFSAEVAWVTRAGSSDLEEPIAIRPTSETVMYPAYARWIRSHRDLPLKLNQWNSVVRWEFKNPQPFLRTREFLWQEGHTAHLYKKEADVEVRQILDLYRRVYEDLLAVPVIPGIKSEKEKFAGGLYTTTVEGFIPASGRGIQGGTSHSLGQNFSKMFNITVEDPEKPGKDNKLFVWQNSWGLSTRTIGVMVMTHSDDKGLVLPPKVAQWQFVVIPTGISAKTTAEQRQSLYDKAQEVASTLIDGGLRAKADLREGYTPGWKYNEWEMRGIPVRLEVGPNDLAKDQVTAVRRATGAKAPLPLAGIAKNASSLLDEIQAEMFEIAKKNYVDRIARVSEWKDFVPQLNAGKCCLIPWCEVEACEDDIKKTSAEESAAEVQDERAPSAGAKSLCIPFDQERWGKLQGNCVRCGTKAKSWTLFGRSY